MLLKCVFFSAQLGDLRQPLMSGAFTRIHLHGAVEGTPGVVDPPGSVVAMTEVRK